MKVLVVEDDREIASFVKRGLEAERFTVEIALDGLQGHWLASEYHYDVIVLDIMLPELNGYKVCAQLREAGIWTPILMLTAKDGDLDEAEALNTGADDFLSKPFSFPVLVARIHALLRRGAPREESAVEVGGVRIDPIQHRVWRGDVEIDLTAREFAVLEYMLRRPGAVVTKGQLLDGIWDSGFDGNPNIIEVYVSRIRRKIDGPFGTKTIETLRGVGYRTVSTGG